jgi:hypothetical protein
MNQPDTRHYPDTGPPPVTAAATGRLAALGGAGFLVTSIAGDLVIGAFPDPDTPAGQLTSFYAKHHAQVLAGGWLLTLSGVFFALFGSAVWARIRQAPGNPMLAGLAMIGVALTAVTTLEGAGTYGLLGGIGGQHAVTPAALQAWHIAASSGSLADGAATFIFLLAVAGAGILARALPRTLAWSALALAVLQLLPDQLGFLASLAFLLWAAVAGIVMLLARGTRSPAPASTRHAPARPQPGSSPAS